MISVEGPIQMIIYKICKMYTKYTKNSLQKQLKNLNSSYVVAQKTVIFPGISRQKRVSIGSSNVGTWEIVGWSLVTVQMFKIGTAKGNPACVLPRATSYTV